MISFFSSVSPLFDNSDWTEAAEASQNKSFTLLLHVWFQHDYNLSNAIKKVILVNSVSMNISCFATELFRV